MVATHKRDSETTWRVVLDWDHALDGTENHRQAAEALLGNYWKEADLVISGRGHDQDAYYWLCVGAWQLQQQQEG